MNHDNHDDRLADEFEQSRDDETTGYNPTFFGRVGSGKTDRLGTMLAQRHVGGDDGNHEWIDPKGDSDIQSPDTPAINPFDIDPISDDNEESDQ